MTLNFLYTSMSRFRTASFTNASLSELMITRLVPVEVRRVVKDVKTSHGENRYAVEIFFMGDTWKLIINSCNIKTFLNDMERQHITRIKTAFIDTGGKHYDVDMNRTEILEVNNRAIEVELDSTGVETGRIVYSDTKEIVNLN